MSQSRSWLELVWSLITTNIGAKLISVIIAIVLWAVVLGSRNMEVTKEIPLEIITPADIAPANEIPEKIAFKLSGPKAFLRSILDRKEEPIRINLSGAKPALVTYRFFSDNIRVPIGVKVLSINPGAILIKLEYLKRKNVPVRLELKGNLPEGFKIMRAEIKPEFVRIKGAESRVDGIHEIVTYPIDISHLTESLEKEAQFDISRYGVEIDSELPRAFIDVKPVSANFRIKNVDIQVISSYKVHVEEKYLTVLVRASSEDIQTLDRSQVFGVVDLSGKPKGRYREPVKVMLPPRIGLVKVIPEYVTIDVQ